MNQKLFFIALLFLNQTTWAQAPKANVAQSQATASKYFIIQNVATEKNRVYEKCSEYPGCPHKLVFETDMLVGKDKDDTRTILGVFKINNWVKFYQDKAAKYPSWYDPNYPKTPAPDSSSRDWMKNKYMPNGEGDVRGAFGWYAATLEPNAFGQWMHGTIGWGSDGDKFINKAKKGFIAFFADLRSHGCSRHENRAIAYLRHLVSIGTPVIKVYAEEKISDASLARYESQKAPILFNYILTKDQVRANNSDSIEYSVVQEKLNKGLITENDILEQGSYLADRYPTVQAINEDKSAKSGKSGDVYDIGREKFRGVFLIDEGRLVNYRHPSELNVGGDQAFKDMLPEIIVVK